MSQPIDQLLGLELTPKAGVDRLQRHALRQSSSALLAALLTVISIALLRPTSGFAGGRVDLMPSAIGAGAAAALGWCYLVDCGNHWLRMALRQRLAMVGVLAAIALLAAGLIKVVFLVLT